LAAPHESAWAGPGIGKKKPNTKREDFQPMVEQLQRPSTEAIGPRLLRGAIGGFVAGLPFIFITMWWASTQPEGSPKGPLNLISTLVLGKSALMTGEVSPWLGFAVHAVLSLAFGMLFALAVPALRSNGTVALAGGIYGALLYLVNFQLLGRIFFDQFLKGPNQPFELVIHVVFGHLLALAFYSSGIRSGERVVALGGQPATAGVGQT
jgi:hypothetical protein